MTVLVTGGTKGIGLAIAAYLARPGDPVVLNYHSDEAAAAAGRERIAATGAQALTVRADVGTIEGCTQLLAETAKVHSGVLHIVHSAALIYPTSLLGADLAQFTRAVQTNGLSLLYLVQKALPLLSRGSSIVFISSAGARAAISPTYSALGTGKALAEAIIRISCRNSHRAAFASMRWRQDWCTRPRSPRWSVAKTRRTNSSSARRAPIRPAGRRATATMQRSSSFF